MKKQNLNIKDFNILYDNVLVKAVVIKERGGVLLPNTNETKPELGEVLATGDGRVFDSGHKEPLQVRVGDIVYFNKYLTTRFDVDGEEYYVLKEEDIVAYKR